MPKTSMSVRDCELQRFYKLTNNRLVSISFTLPRRQGASQFQSDLFPPTFGETVQGKISWLPSRPFLPLSPPLF